MSKRFYPQQHGERKKAKLDISFSDHNFPLSQNVTNNKEPEKDNWGDDNDDEILLLASQACEDVYNDISTLPDYSICMQPGSTSTQMFDPGPSTSKTDFVFKKPNSSPANIVSTNLKDKCSRISSPLPGMSSRMLPKTVQKVDLNDDLIFNEKIFKSQDGDYVYKQLLQLQEENAKLKSENGKLLEKCVTKEGEASILRTQLKACQVAVDNARMEKLKAQEKVQMEWTEKLTAANGQMHDLKTLLDFKDLEIISIKEKCKMLENNKVKLTQVTVANNDINSSHRNNSSMISDFVPPAKKVKTISNGVQTELKAQFLRINKSYRTDPSNLIHILPLLLEATVEQHSILEYNEKLQKHADLSQNKCRIYSTFHRVPTTPASTETKKKSVTMNSLYEDVVKLTTEDFNEKCFVNIVLSVKSVLSEVNNQLQQISHKATSAFLKEMDEKYIETTNSFLVVSDTDLLSGKSIFSEEQGVLARRMVALLTFVMQKNTHLQTFIKTYKLDYLGLLQEICGLLDATYCAILYSGLLLSITKLLEILNNADSENTKIAEIIRTIISCRPSPLVSCELLKVSRKLCLHKKCFVTLCRGGNVGNLKLDYDQGVLLYKKDSCYLQVLLKQIEASLKCLEKQQLLEQTVDVTRHLILLHSNMQDCIENRSKEEVTRCDCQMVLLQIIVYSLNVCAVLMKCLKDASQETQPNREVLAICRCGIQILYQTVLRDVEFASQLGHNEGHLIQFCEVMRNYNHSDTYVNMLAEISSTFQSSPEESCSSFHKQAWVDSFDAFSIAD